MLTILTYNIHHCEGLDNRIDLERIARVISAHSPDVVALQEVDRGLHRSNGVDQAAELAERTGLTLRYAASLHLQGGEYGNAMLTRLPVRGFEQHPLPGEEPRVVAVAHLDAPATPGKTAPFTFLATHLDYGSREARARSAALLTGILDALPEQPAILAGDLNDGPGSTSVNALRETWTVAGWDQPSDTGPADGADPRIDYIMFRPAARWQELDYRVIEEPVASDHRPVLARLKLRAAPDR